MPRRSSIPPPAARRGWLRLTALVWGLALLLGHVLTFDDPIRNDSLSPTLLDAIKHSIGIAVFTLLYRASWQRQPGGTDPLPACLLVCCGWGALCEVAQLFQPLRFFNWLELGLNVAVPAVLLGLWWLVEQVWEA